MFKYQELVDSDAESSVVLDSFRDVMLGGVIFLLPVVAQVLVFCSVKGNACTHPFGFFLVVCSRLCRVFFVCALRLLPATFHSHALPMTPPSTYCVRS
jgi:hypothetical protein